MRTIETKVYPFNELNDKAKENAIGFIPTELEERIMILSKRHNVKFNDTLGILNALIDAKITMKDLEVTPSKSGSAYQNKLERKTKEIWIKAKPKYKGTLQGNMYYSSLRDIIVFQMLKDYKQFNDNDFVVIDMQTDIPIKYDFDVEAIALNKKK